MDRVTIIGVVDRVLSGEPWITLSTVFASFRWLPHTGQFRRQSQDQTPGPPIAGARSENTRASVTAKESRISLFIITPPLSFFQILMESLV